MLLNYQKQFEPHLVSGRKKHTIRAFRKRYFKPGDKLQHYIENRTQKSRKVLENECRSTQLIRIRVSADEGTSFIIDNKHLDDDWVMTLIWNDGFDKEEEFMEFWSNHPSTVEIDETTWEFEGQLIHWTWLKY